MPRRVIGRVIWAVVAALISGATASAQSVTTQRDMFFGRIFSGATPGTVRLPASESGSCTAVQAIVEDPDGCRSAVILVTGGPPSGLISVSFTPPIVGGIGGVSSLNLLLKDSGGGAPIALNGAGSVFVYVGGDLNVPPNAVSGGAVSETVTIDITF